MIKSNRNLVLHIGAFIFVSLVLLIQKTNGYTIAGTCIYIFSKVLSLINDKNIIVQSEVIEVGTDSNFCTIVNRAC